jgi:hypothetical protein
MARRAALYGVADALVRQGYMLAQIVAEILAPESRAVGMWVVLGWL